MRTTVVACVLCCLAGFDGGECARAATTTACSIPAATVSNYAASTTYAAAVIEYTDCTTTVVRVLTDSNGVTQLDLSSKKIVYVESLPSVMTLDLKGNKIALLKNASIPMTIQTLDLSQNLFDSLQNFTFPTSLTKFTASSGNLASLRSISFPDSVTTLNLSGNPIAYIGGVVFPSSLKVLVITSTVKLQEFEVRQTDATLFASLETFNVSITTNLACSDSDALYRYVQNTLLCVLSDEAFNSKYGITGSSSSMDSVAATTAPELPEADSPRRSKFLLFAGISLSLACVGLLSTLAPRTLYERYQKKKYLNQRKKKQLQQQLPPVVKATILQMNGDPNAVYWDL
ncbi:TKL protein kinase [Phytophthora cinnamomi]|uniref:TKL protein kinase n=1 Tax=Phytophthora cinnamomi TaxID=4785 RepID=UPI00355A6B1A|nr:TKL protein kinase [Phytophthora cinnamomi]